MKKIVNNKYFYFSIIFIFMFIFNCMTPYIRDDYPLMYTSNGKRIISLFQILNELYNMYFTWGGRILAHFFTYSFLALPKWIFNIVNSMVYTANIYLIFLIAKGKKEKHNVYILITHMLVFILFPTIGQVFLWLDGSCNYSFTLLFQLLFIYLILNINKKDYFLYLFISILAGMCNENSSLSLIVFLLLYIINNRDNLKVKIVSLVGLIMGYLFMFLAPGNYVRMETVSGQVSFFNHFFQKFFYLLSVSWPIIIGFLVLIIVFYVKNKEDGRMSLLLYLSSLVAFFSMIASPQLSIRSFTICVIYLFIIMMKYSFNIKKDIIISLFIIISLLFSYISFNTFVDYYDYYKFMNNRDKIILKAKKEGRDSIDIEIHKRYNNSRIPLSLDLNDIETDCDGYPNIYMGRYYGIKIYGHK